MIGFVIASVRYIRSSDYAENVSMKFEQRFLKDLSSDIQIVIFHYFIFLKQILKDISKH